MAALHGFNSQIAAFIRARLMFDLDGRITCTPDNRRELNMKTNKTLTSIAIIVALTLPVALLAAPETTTDKPSISATQTVQIVTTVESIDYETRMVTLKGPEGNLETVKAERTPNLEEVEVGDQVNVEYMRNLTIEVTENDGAQPGQGVMTASAVNKPGEVPSGMEMVTTITTATVQQIDLEGNTFKLNMPGGVVEQFTARNPENLKRAAVGDLVVITTTEAIAAYMVEVPTE
jgi:Cu/Ag efflux protein CusF